MFLARKNSQTKEKTEKKEKRMNLFIAGPGVLFKYKHIYLLFFFFFFFFVSLLGKRSLNTDLNFGANDLCISEKPKKSSG